MRHCVKCCQEFKNKIKEILLPEKLIGYSKKHIANDEDVDYGNGDDGNIECSVTQSHPILHDPMDCSPPGFYVHGILQARILERVAISSSRGSSQPRD